MAMADHERVSKGKEERVFLRECRSGIWSKTDIVRERLFERVRMPRGDDSICTLFRLICLFPFQ